MRLVRFFKENATPHLRATLLGGVPTKWRTLEDSKPDPAWAQFYRSLDVICPWMVNVFANATDARSHYRDGFAKDLAECQRVGIGYMPTVFPGFSWKNVQARNQQPPADLNSTKRDGGRFYWAQVSEAARLRPTAVLNAMFDECDEGTAMFKFVARAALPTRGEFVGVDMDNQPLPSDWYLRLAGEAGKMLRGEIPLVEDIPIRPA
jgi:hypothetical protein